MQLSDRTTGAILVTLGALAAYGGSRLDPVPGQDVGPNVFPMVVGAGLAGCGVMIALGIGRSFEAPEELGPDPVTGLPPPSPGRWAGLRALVPPGVLLLYVHRPDHAGAGRAGGEARARPARAARAGRRDAAKVGLVVIERRGNARIVRAADGAWSTPS